MTQEDLAEQIHKTRPLISSIEQTGKVGHHTLQKICQVLDLDPVALENGVMESSETTRENLEMEKKILQMEMEMGMLRDLVESQKELIGSLKAQIKLMNEKKS